MTTLKRLDGDLKTSFKTTFSISPTWFRKLILAKFLSPLCMRKFMWTSPCTRPSWTSKKYFTK